MHISRQTSADKKRRTSRYTPELRRILKSCLACPLPTWVTTIYAIIGCTGKHQAKGGLRYLPSLISTDPFVTLPVCRSKSMKALKTSICIQEKGRFINTSSYFKTTLTKETSLEQTSFFHFMKGYYNATEFQIRRDSDFSGSPDQSDKKWQLKNTSWPSFYLDVFFSLPKPFDQFWARLHSQVTANMRGSF